MLTGLKNTEDLIAQLHQQFDFAIHEECMTYSEYDTLGPFVADNKAVVGVSCEWPPDAAQKCNEFRHHGISGKYCHGDGNPSPSTAPWTSCF